MGWDSPFIQLCSSNDCVRQHCSPYQQALQCYKQIHRWLPDSVDCLKFLERLCSDFGLQDVQEYVYSLKLKKAKKFREAKRPINCPPL